MKVIIVGGVAGGATAAARIRRLNEHAEITVFERSGYISYANCGLPYYIGDVITDPEELTLQTPESFFKRFRINMKIHHEVISIHPERKTVSVKNLENGEIFEEKYDKLILSPGAKPTQPRLPGVGIDKLFTLRTVEDTFRIKEYINKNHPKSAVLAGGGFIGLELAENLRELGMDVTIVQRPKQLMNPFDPDMASMIHNEMRKHGIKLVLGYTVEGFKEKDDRVEVLLKDNPSLQADMVVLAIGVTPDTVLAKEAGLELGIKESIVVNDRMETSVPDIYAAGDAVQVKHYVTGNDALISLAGPANKQGRIIADNICGGDSRYMGSQGSSVIKVFDMTAATTGINETNAKKSGLEVDTVILSPMSHAGYYPGGKVMTMKVVFEKETYRLLGAQIIGYEGVDKRIDVLATAIHAGLKATQLKDLDLAYAPPYSSVKDPVNMAGFMIDNIAKGTLKQWHLEDMDKISRDKSVVLLDVRTVGEFNRGHMDGFKNIPVDELRERISEIEKGKPVYLICQSGLRSYIASRILEGNGYETYNFSGGFRFYDAVVNAGRLMKEGRAQAVKLEGGKEVCPQIKAIVDASIPVCAHLGLTPQSVNAFGGFKVQGKGEAAAQKLLDDARAVEEAGAFAVVLECVPQALATKITESIHIPTIGIGAGAGCDGQVLVYQDMLAMYSNMKPKFVKQFAQVGEQMREAFRTYKEEVAAGTFPAAEHTFKMDETVLDKLY